MHEMIEIDSSRVSIRSVWRCNILHTSVYSNAQTVANTICKPSVVFVLKYVVF